MTLKEIKNTRAVDITNDLNVGNLLINECGLDVIAISHGIYGMNGALFQGRKSKELYKITSRCTNLFQVC